MELSGLFIYPVKSLRGVALTTAEVDGLGLVGDRRFMVVDAQGKFLTQRTLPFMAQIETALDASHLTLSIQGGRSRVRVPRRQEGAPLRSVSVWSSENLQAEDCGEEVAAWLSAFLATTCRLVRVGARFHRPLRMGGRAQPGDVTGFADGAPFLVASETSLAELNRRIVESGGTAVPLDRLRANVIIRGASPFAEDGWARYRIGEVTFRDGGPCQRCVITTTDQSTGARSKEPLRTLAQFRRDPADPTQVIFAQNAAHETKTGRLKLGDRVQPLA